MRVKVFRQLAAIGLASVLLGACAGKSHDAAPTTSAPSPTPTSALSTQVAPPTTASPNPDVIPPVITAAYVNAVFAVLNHINGDVSRSLLGNRHLTSPAQIDLRAIYNNPLYRKEVTIAQQSINEPTSNIRDPPGDIVTTVRKLIYASSTCVFVQTRSDYSAVLIHPGQPAASEYFSLTTKSPDIDPQHVNPTPWALNFNAAYLTPTNIPDQCDV
jgi:hypothetical protein